MPDPTSPGSLASQLGPLTDQRRLSMPRMMSGQFPDALRDPAVREVEKEWGMTLDREAIRARLEQEIGFADYAKYHRDSRCPRAPSWEIHGQEYV
jgi:hypothetical protein